MKFSALKTTRIIFAVLFFLPSLLFFCDFADILPDSLSHLLKLQLVPAILAGSIFTIVLMAALTFLFGRIYCSIICPLGIFQDIVAWFTKRGKKKNKKKRWYNYSKPYTILRYSLLTICVVFLVFGITTPLLLLDPYSNFGRIAVNIFRPIAIGGNNIINWIALRFDNFDFYHVSINTITLLSLGIALIAFFSVGILALLRGRLFCNTICPVGSLLGLLSKFSVFKVILDDSQCTSCGLCEKACKSQCINSKEKTIDHSRCVTCFNCLDRCNKKGVKYRYAYNLAKKSAPLVEKLPVTDNEKGMNRRSFIVTSTAMAATVPFIPAWAQAGKEIDATKLTPITPPGSRSLKHFTEHCTACHLCITHCPAQVLKPAGFTFGFNYVFKPYLSYSIEHYCNYECTVCSEVCPNNAIGRLTVDEKKVVQVGIAQFTQERCVVYTDHTSCGACAEHCPVKAVSMEPYIDNLTLPHMYPELCIGCGGCESICPVRPIRAINVMANSVHQLAQRPKEEEMKEINSEELDFGF